MTFSIDELSRMAGERWAREEEQKRRVAEVDPNRKPKTEPGRALPGHGTPKQSRSASLGGQHS